MPILTLVGFLLLLAFILFVSKFKAPLKIYSRFGASESTHKLLSTDLGNATARIKLSLHGINGIPDAVFEELVEKVILVGEFKSRKYRDRVRLNELYQLMLYMGHLKGRYPNHTILGCLAYADGKVKVAYDHDLYLGLVGLRDEYWQTIKRSIPANMPPLHKRMKVSRANPGLRLTSKM